jgi:hypothetical protein
MVSLSIRQEVAEFVRSREVILYFAKTKQK